MYLEQLYNISTLTKLHLGICQKLRRLASFLSHNYDILDFRIIEKMVFMCFVCYFICVG